jgi:hypothetical protein
MKRGKMTGPKGRKPSSVSRRVAQGRKSIELTSNGHASGVITACPSRSQMTSKPACSNQIMYIETGHSNRRRRTFCLLRNRRVM